MANSIDNGLSYWFESWNTHNVLDLKDQNPANNTPVIGYWAHVGPSQPTNQKWIANLQSTVNNVKWYTLTNAATKTILALPPGATNVVCQTTAVTDGSQYWSFTPATQNSGTATAQTPAFKIKNQASTTFVDIQNDGGNLTPVVSLADAGGAYEHRWIAFPATATPPA